MLDHLIQALPSATEHLLLGVLWYVVMRDRLPHLNRPAWEDMEPVSGQPDTRRATSAQHYREMRDTLALMIPICVFLALAFVTLVNAARSPQQPQPPPNQQQPNTHQQQAARLGPARVTAEFVGHADGLLEGMVDPFAQAHQQAADIDQQQRLSQACVTGERGNTHQRHRGDIGERAIPLVRRQPLFHVHAQSLLLANAECSGLLRA